MAGQACQACPEGPRRALDGQYSKAKPRANGMPQVDLPIPAFGCKNHVSIDRCHGLIRKWTATDAAAYDGTRLADVLG
jgi:transposase, IS5 family